MHAHAFWLPGVARATLHYRTLVCDSGVRHIAVKSFVISRGDLNRIVRSRDGVIVVHYNHHALQIDARL